MNRVVLSALARGDTEARFDHGAHSCTLTFATMRQRNAATRVERPVRRVDSAGVSVARGGGGSGGGGGGGGDQFDVSDEDDEPAAVAGLMQSLGLEAFTGVLCSSVGRTSGS